MSKPIFILGVNRSGTSLLAEMVHVWGAYGGDPDELRRGNQGNLRGYWENKAAQRFLGEIADRLGLMHPALPERLRALAHEPQYRDKALLLVREMEQHSPVWFWKEPLLSLMLPFWQEILDEIVCVVPVRNPYESARSWELFTLPQGLPKGFSTVAANLLRWQHYNRSILTATAGRPVIFIPYDGLLAAPQQHSRKLAAFLDEHCGQAARSLPPDRVERMAEVADPGLQHVRPKVPFAEVPEATPEQKALYALLLRKVEDPTAEFDPELYPLFAGWKEYLQNLALMTHLMEQASPVLNSQLVRLVMAVTAPFRLLKEKLARPAGSAPPAPSR